MQHCLWSLIISARNQQLKFHEGFGQRRKWKERRPYISCRTNFSCTTFRRNGKFAGSGTPRLSEDRIFSVFSQMNTLKKQLTSKVPVPVCRGQGIAWNTGISKILVFRVIHGVLQLYSYKLQSLQQLMPDDVAKWMFICSGVRLSRVYRNSPSSLVKMKDTIRHEFSCIQLEILHAAVSGVIIPLQTVICGNGVDT